MRRSVSRVRRALLFLALLWLAVALLAPLVGSRPLSLSAVLHGDPAAAAIFWQLRLPRVLLALLAGGLLALSGLSLQTLFGNALAEPYTLGVASGASLGAALVFTFAPRVASLGLPLAALAAFAGALAATAVVVALGRARDAAPAGGSGAGLLLAGVAVALLCQAAILLLQYLTDAAGTLRMVRWMMGGLAVVGWREPLWLLPWLLATLAAHAARRWDLDLLLAGEEVAASRGVAVARLRLALLVVDSLAVAALVSVVGPVGFVGLMVPHMLRRLVGAEHGALVPACVLGGGAFLALCDAGARTALAPAELPVGVVTALLGGPFFLWLLRRGVR
ncbi:MAG TPA: iron ABC transporter permease [Thermoanaerobaculia bacterium]|nr:iron ABC transporter permease [Thermoanaerobaculia bacterium]